MEDSTDSLTLQEMQTILYQFLIHYYPRNMADSVNSVSKKLIQEYVRYIIENNPDDLNGQKILLNFYPGHIGESILHDINESRLIQIVRDDIAWVKTNKPKNIHSQTSSTTLSAYDEAEVNYILLAKEYIKLHQNQKDGSLNFIF